MINNNETNKQTKLKIFITILLSPCILVETMFNFKKKV